MKKRKKSIRKSIKKRKFRRELSEFLIIFTAVIVFADLVLVPFLGWLQNEQEQ